MEPTQVGQGAVRGLSLFLIIIFSLVVALFASFTIPDLFLSIFPGAKLLFAFSFILIWGFVFIVAYILSFILLKKAFARYNQRVLIYGMLLIIIFGILKIALSL